MLTVLDALLPLYLRSILTDKTGEVKEVREKIQQLSNTIKTIIHNSEKLTQSVLYRVGCDPVMLCSLSADYLPAASAAGEAVVASLDKLDTTILTSHMQALLRPHPQ